MRTIAIPGGGNAPVLAARFAASLAMTLLATTALAAPAADSSGNRVATVEELVVTAQRREQALEDVGAALSVVTAAQLEERHATNVESLIQQVPNVQVGVNFGQPLISIRGVGTSVDTGVVEPNVAVHIDGLYQPRPSLQFLDFQDIARVEVLRGPQGTLYGRNSTGGSINLISRKPTDQFEAGVSATVGNLATYEGRGYVSGPIATGLAGRLSAFYAVTDGYIDNVAKGTDDANDFERYGVRGALGWSLTDDVRLDAWVMYQAKIQDHFMAFQHVTPPVGWLRVDPGATFSTRPHEVAIDYDGFSKFLTLESSVSLEWKVTEDVTLKLISGYIDHVVKQCFDSDITTGTITRFCTPTNVSIQDSISYSQEANLTGILGPVTFVLGAFVYDEKYKPSLISAYGARGLPPTLPPFSQTLATSVIRNQSRALFADFTFSVTPRLRLVGGLRGAEEEGDFLRFQGFIINRVPTLSCPGVRTKFKGNPILPRVGVEYDLADDVLFYAKYSEGYRPGGFNPTGCNDVYEPERLESYEAGMRAALLDRRLTFAVSAFHYKYDGLQIFQYGQSGFTPFLNNADAKVDGLEAEARLELTPEVSLDFAGSLLDARYTDFPTLDILMPALGIQQVRGNPLNRSPKHSFTLGANYVIPLRGDGEIKVRGEIFHSDEVYFLPFKLDAYKQGAYTVSNLYVTYTSASRDWTVAAFAKNLGDKDYLVHLIGGGTAGNIRGSYGAPRTFGVTLSRRFR